MKVIDVHVHDFDERNIEKVKTLGIEKIYLIHSDPKYLKASIKKHPDFIIGMGWLPTNGDSKEDLAMVEKFREAGCAGLKICGAVTKYDDVHLYPVYEKADKYKMPVVFHTGWLAWRSLYGILGEESIRLKKKARTDFYRPIRLDRVALDFPKLKLVAYHMGHPWVNEAAYVVRMNLNLYGDTVIHGSYTHDSKYFWDLVGGDSEGYDTIFKLLFGSDAGLLEYGMCKMMLNKTQKLLNELKISKALQERVFYKNALDVVNIGQRDNKEVAVTKLKETELDVNEPDKSTASKVTDFGDFALRRYGEISKNKTTCRIGYDTKALHFLFTCADKDTKGLVLNSKGVPSDVWMDDSVEIYISPENNEEYFHFMISAEGFVSGEFCKKTLKEFSRTAYKIKRDEWTVKFSVPFALLGKTPKPGENWGINLIRNKRSLPAEISVWNESPKTFRNTEYFGSIKFNV